MMRKWMRSGKKDPLIVFGDTLNKQCSRCKKMKQIIECENNRRRCNECINERHECMNTTTTRQTP